MADASRVLDNCECGECECECERKIDPQDVVNSFHNFLDTYEQFRESNDLSGSIDNVYEIIAAMTDKLGRVSRYVKHQERNDPKHDWPEGMTSELVGLLVYMIILKNHYGVDITDGMKFELEKSVEQHTNKKEEPVVESIYETFAKEYDDEMTDAPIIRLVSLMFIDAFRRGASTIQIVPQKGYASVEMLASHKSVVFDQRACVGTERIPERLQGAIASRILIMANLKPWKRNWKRNSQEGTIRATIDNKEVELVVTAIPANHLDWSFTIELNKE